VASSLPSSAATAPARASAVAAPSLPWSRLPLLLRANRTLLQQLGTFVLVGGSGAVVNSVLLYLLYQRLQLPLILASVLAVEVAIVNNFLWNNRWTFGRRDLSVRRFATFNGVSLGGLAITTATLWLLVNHAGLPYLLANVLGIALATGWNFAINRAVTWREGHP
jgi:dolichol-phosphate mannosyltransferase